MNYRRRGETPILYAIVIVVVLIVIVFGIWRLFSANNRAKMFGGTQVIELVNATWKQDSLWYLTRPMVAGEKPTDTIMHEQSALGILEGTIVFKESTLLVTEK